MWLSFLFVAPSICTGKCPPPWDSDCSCVPFFRVPTSQQQNASLRMRLGRDHPLPFRIFGEARKSFIFSRRKWIAAQNDAKWQKRECELILNALRFVLNPQCSTSHLPFVWGFPKDFHIFFWNFRYLPLLLSYKIHSILLWFSVTLLNPRKRMSYMEDPFWPSRKIFRDGLVLFLADAQAASLAARGNLFVCGGSRFCRNRMEVINTARSSH